jgi:hypothetical protein
MANSLREAAVIVKDEAFKTRIELVMLQIVEEVIAELPTVPFHNLRGNWAKKGLNKSVEEARKSVFLLAGRPGIDLDATDDALRIEMRSIVNVLAGAFVPEAAKPIDLGPEVEEVVEEETDHDNNPLTPPVVTKITTRRGPLAVVKGLFSSPKATKVSK